MSSTSRHASRAKVVLQSTEDKIAAQQRSIVDQKPAAVEQEGSSNKRKKEEDSDPKEDDDDPSSIGLEMLSNVAVEAIDNTTKNKTKEYTKNHKTSSGKGTHKNASSAAKKRQFDTFKIHFDNMLSNQLNEHLPPKWPSVDSDFFEYATKKVKQDLDMDENTKNRLLYVLDVSMGAVKAVEESNENEVKPSTDDFERIALLESEIESRKAEIQRIKSTSIMMTNVSSSSGKKHAQVWWNTVKALQKVPRGMDYAKKDCPVCRVAVGRIIDLSDHECPYCRCCFNESWKQPCVLREDCVKHHGQAEVQNQYWVEK